MKIKNLLFQPISLRLAIDGEGLHLSAREARDVPADRVSAEIRAAAERGLVSVIGTDDTVPVTDAPDTSVSPTDAHPSIVKKGNRR